MIEDDYYDYDDDDYYEEDDYDYRPAPKPKKTVQKKAPATATKGGTQSKGGAGQRSCKSESPTPPSTVKDSNETQTPPRGTTAAKTPGGGGHGGISVLPATKKSSADATSSPSGISALSPPPGFSSSKPSAPSPPAEAVPPLLEVPSILLRDTSQKDAAKINLSVVFLGHVDAGKSSLTGHLLLGKTARHAQQQQPISWLLDTTEEERAHGVTMDVSTNLILTGRYNLVLLDAPGHAEYVPAMITGTAQADAAVLTVDVTDFKHSTTHDRSHATMSGQLKEHVFLARGLGVRQICIVLNKMDLVDWNEAVYQSAVEQLLHFVVDIVGYPRDKVQCVPVSALTRTNVFPKTSKDAEEPLFAWYTGPSLLEALDQFEPPVQQQSKLLEKPLRIVVTDVVTDKKGVGVTGKVVQGWAGQGEKVTVLPIGDETTLSKLSSMQQTKEAASTERQQYVAAGEVVECILPNVDFQRVSTGSVLARPTALPPIAARCRAKIFLLDGVGVPVIRGAAVIFHMHHVDVPCHVSQLLHTLHRDGATVLRRNPRALTSNTTAVIELTLTVPVCMEAFTECRALGRFVLRRGGDSIAVGRIEEVLQ
jgi:elongation factor 1 alpha-like protein